MDKKKFAAILCGAALLLCGIGMILYYCPLQSKTNNSQSTIYVVTQTDYVYLPAQEDDTFTYEDVQKIVYCTLDGTVHTVSSWTIYYVKDVESVKEDPSSDIEAYLNAYEDGVYVLMPSSVSYANNTVIQFGPAGMTSSFKGAVVRCEGYINLTAENRGETVLIDGYEALNARTAQAFTSKESIAQAMSHVKIEVPIENVNIYYKD